MITTLLPDPATSDRAENSLRIFCLLPTLNPYGGVISVVNFINIAINFGHTVTLASLSRHRQALLHIKTEPLFVDKSIRLSGITSQPYDIALATSWETVDQIAQLAADTGATPVYYVQDFEPDLYEDGPTRARARATYDTISNRIVKTSYLQNRLSHGGWSSVRVSPGVDLDVFYPRLSSDSKPTSTVLAMARPGAPLDHRGFDILAEVYNELYRQRPRIRMRTFGSTGAPFDCPVDEAGRVSPVDLPGLYSEATVFVDTSRLHGFGRTGVEAIACGTPVVLSDSGGIREYAIEDETALVVPVGDVKATVAALGRLLDDPDLRQRLAKAGLMAVRHWSDYVAAGDLLTAMQNCRLASLTN